MLEDFTMEKKLAGRSVQAPGKGNATESKKNQDVTGNKVFPRSSRRREPLNFNGPKHDATRKPVPQKCKSFDKRPRAKGQFNVSGKEDPKVAEDERVEYGSVLMPGSKKQNLNHLLNFHYAPREGATPSPRSWRSNQGGWGRRLIATQKHKYNKEQFLQANCQFVVRCDDDYSPYMANQDLLVNWELIEQVHFRSVEKLSCPICLYPPVAAKMTRCGHVFCWSCILHYLALSDKSWRKCPICYESVHKQDLKSVIAVTHTQFSVGEEITLRLMKRERGCLLALPVDQYGLHPSNKLLSVSETQLDTAYSKLLLATPYEVMRIIERERAELEVQLATEQDCPEICFIEQALELLRERESPLINDCMVQQQSPVATSILNDEVAVVEQDMAADTTAKVYYSSWDDEYSTAEATIHKSLPVSNSSGGEMEDNFHVTNLLHHDTSIGERQHFESMSSEGLESEDGNTNITVEDLETPAMQQSASMLGSSPLKHFYFYQADDGQHIYLHALNVRMLEQQYGSLEHCPRILKGRIVEKETGSMTEELRHRLRYLQHLPVTCQFEVAEIQLKPPVITRATLEQFQDKLEARRQRRQRRARDERRREKWINEEENRRMGRYPSPYIRIESHRHFPQYGTDTEPTGPSSPAVSSVASSPTPDHDSTSTISAGMESLNMVGQKAEEAAAPPVVVESSDSTCGPSFAQMLREGKSRSPVFRTAENTTTLKPSTVMHRTRPDSDSEPEPEGYVPVPTYQQSLSDAITKAMEYAAASKETAQDATNSGKKKKKQKKKVLFATGMAYNGK